MKRLLITFFFLAISYILNAGGLPTLKINLGGSLSDTYLNGSMCLTDSVGNTISLNAKFKKRGATALQYSMKPSLTMKLSNDDYSLEQDSMLLGIRSASSWILDAMAIDRICMRNRVCFDLWNSFSKLPYQTSFNSRNGTEGKFIELYINNEYYGIYCLTDRINRKLLNLKKTEVTDDTTTIRGVLYKHGTTNIGNQEIPGFFNNYEVYVAKWHDAWELSEPEDYPCEEAWLPLIESYNNYKSYDYIKSKFYIDNLADYQILTMALCISDNWGNKNHYFSIRNIQKITEDNSRILISPWDMDTSLGGDYKGSYYGGNLSHEWPVANVSNNSIQPFSTCNSQPEYRQLLHDKWVELRVGALSVDTVAKKLKDYCDLFVNSSAWQQQWEHFKSKSAKPCLVENLNEEINYIIEWYKKRYQEMDAYFNIALDVTKIINNNYDEESYDLQGRKIEKTLFPNKIYITNGNIYISK